MCDTLYLPADRADGGLALFAKNSDRERNEAQALDWRLPRPAAADRRVRASFIAVPDPGPTLACLLSRPFWGFGAEMGVNERGVAIGNEAVQSAPGLPPPGRRGGLTGMDLVRFGLERGATAAEALEIVTGLLSAHGQGGDCGHLSRFHYHNSFLIADPSEAFVLETVGRDFAAARLKGPSAISNAYSIERPDAGVSPGLGGLIGEAGALAPLGLAARLQDVRRAAAAGAEDRAARSRRRLSVQGLGVLDLMAALRDHGGGTAPFDPALARAKSVCMHAGARGRRSQTVASMVCALAGSDGLVWVTAAAAPCLSVFRPLFFGAGLVETGPAPTDRADPKSRFWRHEAAHRRALAAYPEVLKAFAPARDALERRMVAATAALSGASLAARRRAQRAFWAEADALEGALLPASAAFGGPRPAVPDTPFHRSWGRLSRAAGLDI